MCDFIVSVFVDIESCFFQSLYLSYVGENIVCCICGDSVVLELGNGVLERVEDC